MNNIRPVDNMRILPSIFVLLIVGLSYAALPAQIYNLLSSYNVPNSLIAQLAAVNISYNNMSYTALYSNLSNNKLLFLINNTNSNFVLNATQIYLIIRNFTIANSYAAVNKQAILNYMHAFQNSSLPSINYCLYATGLNQYTCNVSNSCYSCQTVPSCNLVMYKTNGIYGAFAQDIMSFEKQYNELNQSFNTFYSSISSMNPKNAAYNLALANSAFANITNLTRRIYLNGLFPPTPNITNAMLSQCIFYPNPSTAPWYCFAFGYCEALTYNFTPLNKISNIMAQVNAKPFTNSQIFEISYNASANEAKYIAPVLYKRALDRLNQILNTTLANYSSIVNNSELVLSHIKSSALEYNLTKLISLRNYTIANFASINLTQYNKSLSSYLANTTALYLKLNATYSSMLSLARNNTALLLKEQLNSEYPSREVANLSFEELSLNNELNGVIGNASSMQSELLQINSRAKALYAYPLGLVEVVRSIDGPFARSMAMVMPMPYQSNLIVAPLYAALLSFLIGLVVFGIIFTIYMNLKMKKRLVLTNATRRNWHILFGLIWLAILVYVSLTYFFALQASSFAPISVFESSVAKSHYVAVALNGTPTLSQYQCGSLISKTLLSMGKQPILLSISNSSCVINNKSISLSACMNFYAQSDIPAVILTNSANNTIKVYSFYGTYLDFEGNESEMNACYPSLLLK